MLVHKAVRLAIVLVVVGVEREVEAEVHLGADRKVDRSVGPPAQQVEVEVTVEVLFVLEKVKVGAGVVTGVLREGVGVRGLVAPTPHPLPIDWLM